MLHLRMLTSSLPPVVQEEYKRSTRGESINEVYKQEKNLNIKVEWFRKSYEYHLCQDTLELCNQEFARVMFDALSK